VLPAVGTSVAAARSFVARHLTEAGAAELNEAAILLTSEIVTNAIRHAGGECEVIVGVDAGQVRVEVHDPTSCPPVLRTPGPTDECGRGLPLVAAIAHRWGSEPLAGNGKTVWFELRREES